MKTLAEQNTKQQVGARDELDSAPVAAAAAANNNNSSSNSNTTTIKLVDTTNIPQHNGKAARKSLTRQLHVHESQSNGGGAEAVLIDQNEATINTLKEGAQARQGNGLPAENLTASLVSKLNGHRAQVEAASEQNGKRQAQVVDSNVTCKENKKMSSSAAPQTRRPQDLKSETQVSTKMDLHQQHHQQQQQQKEEARVRVGGAAQVKEARSQNNPAAGQKEQQSAPAAQQAPEIGLIKKLTIECFLYLIKGLIATYDLISQPVCYFKQEVARRRRQVDQVRSVKFDPTDANSAWRQIDIEPHQLEIERRINSFQTYDQMMKSSYRENAQFPCYGYRQVIDERMSKRPDNPEKLIRQVSLSEYKWCTYGQFEEQIETARRGLLRDGVRAGQRVILFADTRAEWQICSQALIRLGAIVGTMYSTLGIDGIVHTVNETQAQLIITQRDKVDRLARLAHKLPGLKKIIFFETSLYLPRQLGGQAEDEQAFERFAAEKSANLANGIERMSVCRLLKSGLELTRPERQAELEQLERENNGDNKLARRTKDSLAVIMYTSGSTGIPKGVLISHGNIQATIKSFSYVTKDFIDDPRAHICTAYLPLAHIFEFCIESVMLFHGVRFGFASPHTLTDKSPGLMAGQSGDLTELRPTVMIIVPLILDRIVQGVKQALKAQSYFKEQLVSYLIDYKIYWQKRHYETPLVDKLICSKMAVALGGRAKYVICGSAPLSAQTQSYVRAALNLKLPQGFGTTETCAATACQLFDDQSTQNVGLPVSGAHIKLEAWPEGNYQPDDKPNPRGEIVVGGEMIAHGYYNLEEQTREAFYVDAEGRRWYRTGDIGEFLPNGQLKIIDRKKDLVKLQNGEYISLGRVESTLKSNPFTDNFCVFANSNYNYVIALGPANELAVKTLAQQIVDENERRLSPSMMKRFNGSQTNLASANQESAAAADLIGERQTLITDSELQTALAELKEVLASYDTDRLNNNNEELPLEPAGSRSRAGSGNPIPPLASCLNERLNRLCLNKLIQERVLAFVSKMARERNLLTLEIPKKIMLLAEEWTEDKNLVTAAMKIRRNYIYKRYERELEQVYAQ